MSELGDEPDLQDVNSRGFLQHDAPPRRRSSDEVGVAELEFTPVRQERDERYEWSCVLQIDDFSDVNNLPVQPIIYKAIHGTRLKRKTPIL